MKLLNFKFDVTLEESFEDKLKIINKFEEY